MNQNPIDINLTPGQLAQMEADIVARLPEEACGFVIGIEHTPTKIIAVTNILHDPYRFRMDPKEELDAFIQAEDNGEEILAVYHSHPHGIDHPSASDIDELTFPGIIYLIWFQRSESWQCRAYLMQIGVPPIEVPVRVSTILER